MDILHLIPVNSPTLCLMILKYLITCHAVIAQLLCLCLLPPGFLYTQPLVLSMRVPALTLPLVLFIQLLATLIMWLFPLNQLLVLWLLVLVPVNMSISG